MDTKHTPGPWKIGRIGTPNGLRPAIYGPLGEQVADLSADLLDHAEQQANARLIAAAPELLEALEAIAMDVDFDGLQLDPRRLAKLRAAIAKATGTTI